MEFLCVWFFRCGFFGATTSKAPSTSTMPGHMRPGWSYRTIAVFAFESNASGKQTKKLRPTCCAQLLCGNNNQQYDMYARMTLPRPEQLAWKTVTVTLWCHIVRKKESHTKENKIKKQQINSTKNVWKIHEPFSVALSLPTHDDE